MNKPYSDISFMMTKNEEEEKSEKKEENEEEKKIDLDATMEMSVEATGEFSEVSS